MPFYSFWLIWIVGCPGTKICEICGDENANEVKMHEKADESPYVLQYLISVSSRKTRMLCEPSWVNLEATRSTRVYTCGWQSSADPKTLARRGLFLEYTFFSHNYFWNFSCQPSFTGTVMFRAAFQLSNSNLWFEVGFFVFSQIKISHFEKSSECF